MIVHCLCPFLSEIGIVFPVAADMVLGDFQFSLLKEKPDNGMRIQEWPVLKLELLFISFQVLVLDWDADSFNCLGGIQRGKKTQNILEPLLLQQAYDL